MNPTPPSPAPAGGRLLAALRGSNTGRPPVWLLRQAGRYLPEYQEVRRRHSFVEMCTRPELACEVSLQPYRAFGLDAVIVFYDILFLAEALGAPLEFTERGPVFRQPLRSREDIRRLRPFDPEETPLPVFETLSRLRAELPAEIPVLGFAGAPFTVAAYLVEGDFRRSGDRIKRLLNEDPELLLELLEALARATGRFLAAQVEAGAAAVQLFDTWAGLLGLEDYESFALPYEKAVFDALAPQGIPRILYVNGCAHLLETMARSGAEALSIDWRVSLAEARRRLDPGIALQGNLDPAALFAPLDTVRRRARALLESAAGDSAFIFNLGHGILPETPVDSVRALVETVKSLDAGAPPPGTEDDGETERPRDGARE
jgi:uroporphyrinogen decarboxylase